MGGKGDIDYLTFVALEDGTFSLSTNDVYYSVDKGATWSLLAAGTQSPTIARGNSIMWKGELTPRSGSGVGTFSSTGMFDAQGNAMSLLYGDDFKDRALKAYAFYFLFNNSKIVNAANVSLPATTLENYCYERMFFNCKNLSYIKCLATNMSASHCVDYWLMNVSTTGTFVKDSSATWATGVSGIPEGWIIESE